MNFYGRSAYGGDWIEGLAANVIGLALLMAIVAAVIAAWLSFRLLNFLVRVFARYPHVKALWVSLALCLGAWAATAASASLLPRSSVSAVCGAVAVTATLGLLLVARYVQVQQDEVYQAGGPKEPLITKILARSWWPSVGY